MKKIVYLAVFFCLLFSSCSGNNGDSPNDNIVEENDLESLPQDTGGLQQSHILGKTNAIYGHYIYTPSNYGTNSPDYPLLIFLHGAGQVGNSQTNPDELKKLLYTTGPPDMIHYGRWSPKYPMIVASPQLTAGRWNPDDVHSFIEYIIANYNINTSRIYITGYSLGAYGSFEYISKYGDDAYAAAIVPIAGNGNKNSGNKFKTTAVWAFHGDNDGVVSKDGSIDMVNAINAANPNTRAKLTLYPGVGHDSDTRTFNGTGMGTEDNRYDTFNMSIYEWMFQFKKQH